MTLDTVVENPERFYCGSTYGLHIDSSDPQEPIVAVYRRDEQIIHMIFNQVPGLCWNFARCLDSFLDDPTSIDLLAEDIIDYLNNEMILSIEEGPPEDDDYGPIPRRLYEQLSLFPSSMLSEKKSVDAGIPSLDPHQWNPYSHRKYCFFD